MASPLCLPMSAPEWTNPGLQLRGWSPCMTGLRCHSLAMPDALPTQRLVDCGEAHQAVHDCAEQVLVAERAGASEGRDQVEVGDCHETPVHAAIDQHGGGNDVELL